MTNQPSVHTGDAKDIQDVQKVGGVELTVAVQIEIPRVEDVQPIAFAQGGTTGHAALQRRVPFRACATWRRRSARIEPLNHVDGEEVSDVHPA